ncbi:hypothetical protein GGQ68_001328 [Sagittula marina]|uniref:Uncharacterized protein n=1 Tax=Sagittula marina TaxID=943940 RepID=A0A7W6DLX0_9RHOB|nr:hypothetical protein [Sagittula marina]
MEICCPSGLPKGQPSMVSQVTSDTEGPMGSVCWRGTSLITRHRQGTPNRDGISPFVTVPTGKPAFAGGVPAIIALTVSNPRPCAGVSSGLRAHRA